MFGREITKYTVYLHIYGSGQPYECGQVVCSHTRHRHTDLPILSLIYVFSTSDRYYHLYIYRQTDLPILSLSHVMCRMLYVTCP